VQHLAQHCTADKAKRRKHRCLRILDACWLDREESMKPESKLRILVDIAIMNSTAEA
jgi:hypothetical protein